MTQLVHENYRCPLSQDTFERGQRYSTGSQAREWASKRVSAAERASEVSSNEHTSEWAVRANERVLNLCSYETLFFKETLQGLEESSLLSHSTSFLASPLPNMACTERKGRYEFHHAALCSEEHIEKQRGFQIPMSSTKRICQIAQLIVSRGAQWVERHSIGRHE